MICLESEQRQLQWSLGLSRSEAGQDVSAVQEMHPTEKQKKIALVASHEIIIHSIILTS